MSKSFHPDLPIIITPGEPLGIGPDVVIQLIQQKLDYPYIIVGDPESLSDRANKLGLSFNPENIHAVKLNSRYVLNCLDIAADLCLHEKGAALLTGPANKTIINQNGFDFLGHTHYLAELTKTQNPVMFFDSPFLKIGLVTDHLPLNKVSEAITTERLTAVIAAVSAFIKSSNIAVCGLNPHAGENGYLGQEENKIIIPTIKNLQKKYPDLSGPHSADSLFYENNLKKHDAVIAMYHDQGLCVLKHRNFKDSVNITLGLPFLRTSVDHGTAMDLAGTGKADSSNIKYVFSKTVEFIYAQTP
ncbi:MAG: 4-hydroxythreonine-4-phosphate dehydrogenase PdxA [Gammaproteobacteria bacterium]|nr:4-hydroxythreonine-4-phosphate dehydrogenase PdxA [Gammaproteobacteria bacterium]